MLGLYVHIPFCDKLCKYCDFAKVASDVMPHRTYLEALAAEYQLYQDTEPLAFDTVYFGGGTPSALNEADLHFLLTLFASAIQDAKEVTFEANPESLTEGKIALLRQYGVNRLSIGVQTFDERRLRLLNRGHTNEDVARILALARQAGFQNINLDLMYGLPRQTTAELLLDVEKLLALQPQHISTYALIFEPHTPFYLQLQQHKLQEVDEAVQEAMYRLLQERFAAAGYEQYEFSNWAKNAAWSRHNTKYWDLSPYVGLGLGSHGYYRGKRYENTRSLVNYVALLREQNRYPYVEAHVLTEREQMEELMFLGLRLRAGVEKQKFQALFGQTIEQVFGASIAKHLHRGNLIETATHYQLTPDAFFISNAVLSDFLLDDEKEGKQ